MAYKYIGIVLVSSKKSPEFLIIPFWNAFMAIELEHPEFPIFFL